MALGTLYSPLKPRIPSSHIASGILKWATPANLYGQAASFGPFPFLLSASFVSLLATLRHFPLATCQHHPQFIFDGRADIVEELDKETQWQFSSLCNFPAAVYIYIYLSYHWVGLYAISPFCINENVAFPSPHHLLSFYLFLSKSNTMQTLVSAPASWQLVLLLEAWQKCRHSEKN